MGHFVRRLLVDRQLVEACEGRPYADTDPYRETEISRTPEADVAAAVLAATRALTDTN